MENSPIIYYDRESQTSYPFHRFHSESNRGEFQCGPSKSSCFELVWLQYNRNCPRCSIEAVQPNSLLTSKWCLLRFPAHGLKLITLQVTTTVFSSTVIEHKGNAVVRTCRTSATRKFLTYHRTISIYYHPPRQMMTFRF